MSRFRSRKPRYPDDSDYTTNAPSYYDDLARKNKLIQVLAERIGYYDEELAKRFKEWDKNLEDLPDELKRMFLEWVDDGTLARILAQLLLDDYATKKEVNQLITELSNQLNNDLTVFKNQVNNELDNLREEVEDVLDGFYHEVDLKTYRSMKYDTTYYLIKIPKTDSKGNRIVLKHGLASDRFSSTGTETVRDFSKRKAATVASNLSPSTTLSRIIHNGVILNNTQSIDSYRKTLAFDNQGNMKSFNYDITAGQILSEGFTEAMTSFNNLIKGGAINHNEINELSDYLKGVNPRTTISKDSVGNTYIMVSDGRRIGERGFKASETAEILLSHNMTFAQMLDGGGSTQATLYHSNVNKLSDSKGGREDQQLIGQTERLRSNFLYVSKDKINKPLNNILSQLGDINKNASDRLANYENLQYKSTNWRPLGHLLMNGWEEYSSTGSNAVRAWVMNNNTLYLVGNIRYGDLGKPFMILPPEMRPNFTLSFVVSGRQPEAIFRAEIESNGTATLYALTNDREGQDVGYCKLDGIFIPLNPNYDL